MDTSFEQKVRERAYHLWLDDGMAHGCAEDHWLRAEQALAAELTPTAFAIPADAPRKPAQTVPAVTTRATKPTSRAKKAPARKAARH